MLQIQKMLKGEQKQKSRITEKIILKGEWHSDVVGGWHRRQQDEVSLLQNWVREARCQPSGDWQEPGKKRKGHWSWDKWFGSKEKREQVWEKTQDSPEERA